MKKTNQTSTRKDIPNKKDEGIKRYGLLSIMAMIVGIIIGAGIHTMNQGLVEQTGSIALTMYGWLIGGVLVISLVIAFIEIISITEITGEQATLANWSRHLVGPTTSKFISYFMVFGYFPVVLGAFFKFLAFEIVQLLCLFDNIAPWFATANHQFIFISVVSISLLLITCLINARKFLPGKIFQDIGTLIKLIPIFFLSILLIVLLIKGDVHFAENQEIISTSPNFNHAEGAGAVGLVLLTLPAILFSIDGFAAAGGLSNEAKSKNTFRIAFVVSMLFIIVVYILYSAAVYGLGTPDTNPHDQAYGTVGNAIFQVFGDTKTAFGLTVGIYFTIIISISVGASGLTLGTARMVSDLSAHNMIADPEAKTLLRNESGMSVKSGMIVFAFAFLWWTIYTIFDFLAILGGSTQSFLTANYGATMATIFAFLTYLIVICGAIHNRSKDKYEQTKVHKILLFKPFAYIAAIFTTMVILWFAITTFLPYEILTTEGTATSAQWAEYICCLSVFIIFIIFNVIVFIVNQARSKKLTKEQIAFKKKMTKQYYGGEDVDLGIHHGNQNKDLTPLELAYLRVSDHADGKY